jgi:hypothetical protein
VFWEFHCRGQSGNNKRLPMSSNSKEQSADQAALPDTAERFDITRKIKVCLEKADRADQRADDLRVTAAQHIQTVKNKWPECWLEIVAADCNIGRSWAYALLKIADGRADADEQRAKNAEANRRLRAAKVHHGDGLASGQPAAKPESPKTFDELCAEAKRMGATLSRCVDRENSYDLDFGGDRRRGRERRCKGLEQVQRFLKEEADKRAAHAAGMAALEYKWAEEEQASIATDLQATADSDDIEVGGVEEPEKVLTNVLDSIKQSKAVAEAYRKILKVSSFDRAAKQRISDEIGLLIRKWKSVQSTLAAPPDGTPSDPGSVPDGETEPKDTTPPAETVSAVEEPTAPIDHSLDIPHPLIQAARQRHPVASATQDTPVPISPPTPAPAPAPTPAPSPPTWPRLRTTYVFQSPDDPSWREFSNAELEAHKRSAERYCQRFRHFPEGLERARKHIEDVQELLDIRERAKRVVAAGTAEQHVS